MVQEVIHSVPLQAINIVIEGPTKKTWKLCLDYRALAKIEDATGLDIKSLENWKRVSSSQILPKVIHCCLGRFSPEVSLDDVIDSLNPQAHVLLSNVLFELTFPGVTEAWEKQQAEKATQ